MSDPAFSLVTRAEFEAANPGVDYKRCGCSLSQLLVEGQPVEVLHRLYIQEYFEPYEEFLWEAAEPDVTLEDAWQDQTGRDRLPGERVCLFDLLRGLDYDIDSYRLWSQPENRAEYPYAAEYEARYGPDVPAGIAEWRARYTASEAGAEVLRYYQAIAWLDQHGVGDRW
jgi:hypothetical protein